MQIFGSKRNEDGEWKRLHNEELHSLYCSGSLNLEEKRTLGRPMFRWEDNISIVMKEIGVNTRNWIDLV